MKQTAPIERNDQIRMGIQGVLKFLSVDRFTELMPTRKADPPERIVGGPVA